MALFGKSFTYNNKNSDDFDLVLCTMEPIDEVPMGLQREIIKGNITSNRPVANHYNVKYSDVLAFEITFLKRNKERFNRTDIREINAWLTSPKHPCLLHILDFDDMVDEYVDYFGCFTEVSSSYASGVITLTYIFTCNAPYGWSKEYTYDYTCKDSTSFICYNSSDELQEFIYPFITVTATAKSSIVITNETEIEDFKLTFPNNDLPLYIDSKNHKIYQIIGSKEVLVTLSDLGWDADTLSSVSDGSKAIYWFRLVPGQNKISVTGNCNISLSYRVPRKVGAC